MAVGPEPVVQLGAGHQGLGRTAQLVEDVPALGEAARLVHLDVELAPGELQGVSGTAPVDPRLGLASPLLEAAVGGLPDVVGLTCRSARTTAAAGGVMKVSAVDLRLATGGLLRIAQEKKDLAAARPRAALTRDGEQLVRALLRLLPDLTHLVGGGRGLGIATGPEDLLELGPIGGVLQVDEYLLLVRQDQQVDVLQPVLCRLVQLLRPGRGHGNEEKGEERREEEGRRCAATSEEHGCLLDGSGPSRWSFPSRRVYHHRSCVSYFFLVFPCD